jgi:two-component system, LytTR family, sensor kinase
MRTLNQTTRDQSQGESLRQRLRPLGEAAFLWLVMVAVYSTASAPAGVALAWPVMLQRSIVGWTIWILLLPLIIKVDRSLPISRDAHLKRFAFHIPLSLVFTAAMQLLESIAFTFLPYSSQEAATNGFRLSVSSDVYQAHFLAYWVVVSTYVSIDYHKHLKEREIQTAEMERLVADSRLETLRAQLNPHFLFNALDVISAQVESTPRAARRMLEDLGELLRLALAQSEDQEVPLATEIALVERYLEVQKAGFAEPLAATIRVDNDVLQALVPTFVLQPLVEHAILQMMSPEGKKSCVEVRAWKTDNQLHLRVQQDGPGTLQREDTGQSSGIAISNIRERMRHLYGDNNQSFEISRLSGDGVQMALSIPFKQA